MESQPSENVEVVISGVAGRFPSADDVTKFKENLFEGVDMVTEDPRRQHWNFDITNRNGRISGVSKFDAAFFGVHSKQADAMDPVCRMLLEKTFEAILDAGYNPRSFRGTRCGVFMGATISETESLLLYDEDNPSAYNLIGCAKSMLANRISYWLGVTGPSFCLDTACSSSMYALEQGYRAIKDGRCESAIVGSAHLCLHPYIDVLFNRVKMLSADGICHCFDKSANGYVRSEAACVVLLQKKTDARRIYCSVVHTKTNCDGFKIEGLTHPSTVMQAQLMREVYEECGVDPGLVGLVEAHVTGTKAGDPEEGSALDMIFCGNRSIENPLLIGALKSSIGHTEPVSGLCAVVKSIITMETGFITPNLHFSNPNPDIEGLVSGRMKMVTKIEHFPGQYIGVNSFGFGGANCHLLLKRHSRTKIVDNRTSCLPKLVTVSGRTEEAVKTILQEVKNNSSDAEFIRLLHEIHAEDIPGHTYRGYTVLADQADAADHVQFYPGDQRSVWFIFTGMGSQWPTMGRHLLDIPVFRTAVQKCHDVLSPLGLDLLHILTTDDPTIFDNVLHSFVGITSVQIGLVDVLHSLNIFPDYILGHSVGELGCAYADGCLTAEQTILSAYFRGLVSVQTPLVKGTMVAVGILQIGPVEDQVKFGNDRINRNTFVCEFSSDHLLLIGMGYSALKDMVPPEIIIACHNSATSSTLSGPAEAVASYAKQLKTKDIFVREVNVSNIPFHSPYIKDMGPKFLSHLKKVIPVPVARSSKWISSSVPEEEWSSNLAKFASAEYMVNNLLSPVLFEEASQHIPANAVTIEIGPHALLQAILKRSLHEETVNVALTRRGQTDNLVFLNGLGRLFELGLQPKLSQLYPKISFPVGRGTPMISPLIRWQHAEDFFVMKYKGQDAGRSGKGVQINVKDKKWAFIADHVVDGRNLFPAAGYLFLVWETLAQFRGEKNNQMSVVFENVKFQRATTVKEDKNLEFNVLIQKGAKNFEVIQGDAVLVSGRVFVPETMDNEPAAEDPSSGLEVEDSCVMDKDDVYKELSLRGYQYKGQFQGIRSVNLSGKNGDICWNGNWVTFMDSFLQLYILGIDTRQLVVPSFIRRLTINTKKHWEVFSALNSELPVLSNKGFASSHKRRNVRQTKVENTAKQLEQQKYEELTVVWRVTLRNKFSAFQFYLDDHRSIYRSGGVTIEGAEVVPISKKKNLEKRILERFEFIPHLSETQVVNTQDFFIMVLEMVAETFILRKLKLLTMVESVLPYIMAAFNHVPSIQVDTTLLSADSGKELDEQVTVKNSFSTADKRKYHIAVGENLLSQQKMLKDSLVAVVDNGFVLTMESLETSCRNLSESVVVILDHRVDDKRLLLLRKKMPEEKADEVVVNTDQADLGSWFLPLQNLLQKNSKQTVLLTAEGNFPTGLLGFTKTLRKELGDNVRAVISDQPFKFDKERCKGLGLNVMRAGVWGGYYHLPLQRQQQVPVRHAECIQTHRGDLSSIKLFQSSVNREDNVIHVHYAGLNFRDVMSASGKLVLEFDRLREGKGIGIEFSGVDSSGRRVMGMARGGTLATTLKEEDCLMCLPVPDAWTLEEAATVPIVYATVCLAFTEDGRLGHGDTVLIHAGAGGVGIAAIRVALHYGCRVFTTVGTTEKRAFLKKTFPQLDDEDIGNSRDISFEDMVMRRTTGAGVDVVLNSLTEDKLHASLRCLAKFGKFLEIGKYDIMQNNHIDLSIFAKGTSFHSIMLDEVLNNESQKRKQTFINAFNDFMKSGIVKPLERKVFDVMDVASAFRYMAAGKHIGKIVVKIRNENDETPPSYLAEPAFHCQQHKSYVIAGGLGGIGLEVTDWLFLRGARKFVFTTRSGVQTGYQASRIQKWKSNGAQVSVVVDPMATVEGVRRILNTAETLGPVDAIFNLALVLKDNLFEALTLQEFEESLAPKATATKFLDIVSRELCPHLQHFVVFSSVSCGRGSPGQSNYCMSNGIMEDICEKRAREGFPALAIQFGPVKDVGILRKHMDGGKTEKKLLDKFKIYGFGTQSISSCLDALNVFLMQNHTVVSSIVISEKTAEETTHSLTDSVLKILGIRTLQDISIETTLTELGLDSLAGVELQQILDRQLEILMTPSDIRQLTFAKMKELQNNRK